MPPTYSPFWKPFEALARLGLGRRTPVPSQRGFHPAAPPLDAAYLHAAWGAPVETDWSAYHRPTLFAALDAKATWTPKPVDGFSLSAAPYEMPGWLDGETAVLLDLPGPVSVAYAAWLAARKRLWPVSTFNNWPHPKGLVDMDPVLGALLAYVDAVTAARGRRRDDAPPALMLDARRLGTRQPVPDDFDNRYYLLDSDLPSAATFAKHGITRVVYVHPPQLPTAPPDAPVELDDLNPYLFEIGRRMQVHAAEASLAGFSLGPSAPLRPTLRKTPFNTTRDPAFAGFRRNAAGGFGALVPTPSSGGG